MTGAPWSQIRAERLDSFALHAVAEPLDDGGMARRPAGHKGSAMAFHSRYDGIHRQDAALTWHKVSTALAPEIVTFASLPIAQSRP